MKQIIKGGISVAKIRDGSSVTIKTKKVEYSLSSSGTAVPESGWAEGPIPARTHDNPYLWTRTTVVYSTKDGDVTTVAYSASRDGVSVQETKTLYAASSSCEAAPTDGWQESEPDLSSGLYLWKKQVVTYTDGTTSETLPACDINYIARVLRKGRSALMGGLVLGNILAASDAAGADAAGEVRSFLSGLLNAITPNGKSLPALGLGVDGFGTDTYKAITELFHDGTGHLGRLFIEKGPYGGTADSLVLKDLENVARVFFSYASLIPLATLLTQSSGVKGVGSFSFSVTAAAGEEATAYAAGKDLSVPYDGSMLDVEGTITVPATDVITMLNVLLVDLTDGTSINIGNSNINFNAETVPFSFELGNAKGHTWRIEARYYNVRGSVSRTATVSVTRFRCVYSSDQRRVGIGRNGFQAFLNSTRYFQVDEQGDATVKTDSVQAKTTMTDKLTIGSGWGFGVLWMGYIGENAIMGLSTGPLRAKGKGTVTKSGSDYTISFPGGSSTVGTDYVVFCQPEKPSNDGRYVTVYGKTSSSFHVATRWGDSQRDASFSFMVVSMRGWY